MNDVDFWEERMADAECAEGRKDFLAGLKPRHENAYWYMVGYRDARFNG